MSLCGYFLLAKRARKPQLPRQRANFGAAAALDLERRERIGRRGRSLPLTAYLDGLERIGVPIVLMQPKAKGSPAKPLLFREAQKRVRKAGGVTLAACRHGGLTELGDAELTEQGAMALAGHKDPAGGEALRQAHRSSAKGGGPQAELGLTRPHEQNRKRSIFRMKPLHEFQNEHSAAPIVLQDQRVGA
jgi:hypothetical protein